ncbi:cysteine desulfurase [Flavobacterium sp. WLB]|uniref:cysteine desulfurase family protein n=1 Tax=unclassified Flavobacterium TaxID=196869 RepID=UPI0006AB93A4|nr:MULTISPECIES: cysteine desulfurase family protein [unclassified Flavobacterium]KOP38307.1 cysteine desulfurase [Flavobacterium sp. VMW]OWU92194.1 cysteine desulfurase IscS [Flavobacterium sp. NLM]PUU71446.1 cysteine desulfurase [Flavobacterium sp. WLB]
MPNQQHIYLDNNATTRVDERVLKAMLPYFTDFYANSTSQHIAGLSVNEAVENAAWQTADLINADADEIIFTSGATEAINLAIKGLADQDRKHIVTVATEHKAVLETCRFMESIGFEVSYLPVNREGILDLNLLSEIITDKTLVFIGMLSNNETGVIQNVSEISTILKSKNVLFLCDATQAVGKIPIDVKALGIDLLTLSAHKFYGPKGVGALYISAKAKIKLLPQILGGGHQRKLRSGTLNVPGIIGLGKAAEIAVNELETDKNRIKILRNKLEKGLLQFEGSFINGNIQNRIYNTSNICFPGVNSEKLIMALGNISVSNGASCSAVTSEPSHVLKAMGLSDEEALSSIRFSLGRFTTLGEIDIAVERVLSLAREFATKTLRH